MKKLITLSFTALLISTCISALCITTYTVNSDEIWDDPSNLPDNIFGEIIIKNNSNLIIRNLDFTMYPGGKITVEAGSYLYLYNTQISCDISQSSWQGILVKGNANLKQSFGLVNGTRPQGILNMRGYTDSQGNIHYSALLDADVGVKVESGGICRAYLSKFTNCKKGVRIEPYSNPHPDFTYKNMCCFDECVFMWLNNRSLGPDGEEICLNSQSLKKDYIHIDLHSVQGVCVFGCKFYSFIWDDEFHNYVIKYPMSGNYPFGVGISARNSYVTVSKSFHYEKYEIENSPSCIPNGKPNVFLNLVNGVFFCGNNEILNTEILYNNFFDCTFPIKTLGYDQCDCNYNTIIYKNNITLNKWATCDFKGIDLDIHVFNGEIVENTFTIYRDKNSDTSGYSLQENHVYIYDGTTGNPYNNEYYLNTFNAVFNFGGGKSDISSVSSIFIDGTTNTGVEKINCNIFDVPNISSDYFDIKLLGNQSTTYMMGSFDNPLCNEFRHDNIKLLNVGTYIGNTTINYYYGGVNQSSDYLPDNTLNTTLYHVSTHTCSSDCQDRNPCTYYPSILDVPDPHRLIEDEFSFTIQEDKALADPSEDWNNSNFDEDLDDPTPGVIPQSGKIKADSFYSNIDSLINFKIYPNPSNSYINIAYNIDNYLPPFKLEIYSALGELLYIKYLYTNNNILSIKTNTIEYSGNAIMVLSKDAINLNTKNIIINQ